MEQELINFILFIAGSLITILLGVAGYLLSRILDENDKFKDETRRNFRQIRQEINDQGNKQEAQHQRTRALVEESGFDQKTKAKISSLAASTAQVQEDFQKVKPVIEETKQSFGHIIWLQDKVKAQDKKLLSLFEILKAINSKRKDQ